MSATIIFYSTSIPMCSYILYDIQIVTGRINSDKKVVELEIHFGTIIWYSHLYSDVHNPCGL